MVEVVVVIVIIVVRFYFRPLKALFIISFSRPKSVAILSSFARKFKEKRSSAVNASAVGPIFIFPPIDSCPARSFRFTQF